MTMKIAPWGKERRARGEGTFRNPSKPATHTPNAGEKAQNSIFYPILGVIDTLYFSDDPRNLSNRASSTQSTTNVASHTMKAPAGDEYLYRSVEATHHTGQRLEARVKIVLGPSGQMDSGEFIDNVPLCIGFGGAHNYGYVVPTPTSNANRCGYVGTEDGDYCLVTFIGGKWSAPVITSTFPSPINSDDPALISEDILAYMRVNGTQVTINKDGNFILDARNANESVSVNPDDGTTKRRADTGIHGSVTVATRSDIYLAAGFPRPGEDPETLPKGTLVARATKDVEMFSTQESVKLYTHEVSTYVDVQGTRGSLRKAARQFDQVKITAGNDGDLFDYLAHMRAILGAVSMTLSASADPMAAAAGVILQTFVDNKQAPSYQTGKITTGSDYCRIAGVGTASDIGFDESGIVDLLGDPIPEDELESELDACTTAAVTDYVEEESSEFQKAKQTLLFSVASALKSAEFVLKTTTGGQAAAFALNLLAPEVMSMLFDDLDSEGGSSLSEFAEAVNASKKILQNLKDIRDTELTSWDIFNLGDKPSENKIREEMGVEGLDNNPQSESLDFVEGSGWWYTQADLDDDDPGPFYNADAIPDAEEALKGFTQDLQDEAADLLASYLPDTSLSEALAMAALLQVDGDTEGAVQVLKDFANGSIEESANTCMNDDHLP